MAVEPYSDRLYMDEAVPGGAPVVLYTVPAQERHVFLDVRLRANPGGLVQLYVLDSVGNPGIIVRRVFGDDETYHEAPVRPTARAGDQVALFAPATVAVTVYLSGYRLSDP